MTIEEAKELKAIMERNIRNEVNGFSDKTGVLVDEIILTRNDVLDANGNRKTFSYKAEVSVRL